METQANTDENLERTIDLSALTALHWRIWLYSSMGIFIEGFNLFSISVALPLILQQYQPSPMMQGLVGGSVIIGTVFGAAFIGRLGDIWGRKKFYVMNALIVTVFSILAGFSWNLHALILFQFFLGVGIGADYPLCASYVSEFMPSRIRGRMIIGAFSFQAIGMLTAAVVGLIILKICPNINAWHFMLAAGSLPAFIIFILRTTVPESPRWCIENGFKKKAIKTISKLSEKSKKKVAKMVKKEEKKIRKTKKKAMPMSALFSKEYLRRTILASIPWFFMDIATYGIGIFTPTIIATIITEKGHDLIKHDIVSLEGAAIIDIFLVIGLLINILLVERIGRIRLQCIGFIGMTAGLIILSVSVYFPHTHVLYLVFLFSGFIIYNFLMNMGPNATTFILPAELFPTKLRATAHGFSAAFAKLGAVVGILFLPILIDKLGIFYSMLIIACFTFLGFLITVIFKFETMGKSLEELSHFEAGQTMSFRQVRKGQDENENK
ncbi:MAG: MFS transporter [Victivallales bacterium]|nr:MFS transporter [Victivallales bacterium]